jgi:filamentous hemagglutinin
VDRDVPGRRLPEAESAFVEPAKLTEYLLNPEHPIGGDKAAFLSRFGFHRDAWRVLEAALLRHAREGVVVADRVTAYGHHFTVEGPLPAPDGRAPIVRTAWMVALGERRPRFVTAHPGRRRVEGSTE